jgi:hypothetical protein
MQQVPLITYSSLYSRRAPFNPWQLRPARSKAHPPQRLTARAPSPRSTLATSSADAVGALLQKIYAALF